MGSARTRICLLVAALSVFVETPAHAQLPEPTYPSAVRREAYIQMDDGVRLAADLHFPSLNGVDPAPGQFPVVLDITPYGKDASRARQTGLGPYTDYPRRGYVRVQVDARGMGASEGNLSENYFSPREQRDSLEVIEWLGTQPWSTGRVGMRGGSYKGINQYLAAGARPEHLKAIVPKRAFADLYRDGTYPGGIFSQLFGLQYLATHQNGVALASGPEEQNNVDILLAAKLGQLQAESVAWDYLEHTTDGAFYRARSPIELADRIEVPVLIHAGWFDMYSRAQSEMWRALERRRGVETRIWFDPTPHQGAKGPENPAGYSAAQLDNFYAEGEFEFFERHLKLERTPDRPRVKAFVMGRDEYYEGDSWPPSGVGYERLFLRPGGFSATPPPQAEESYLTNPIDGWTNTLSRDANRAATPYLPLDQQLEEGAGLTWETESLTQPLTVTGPISMRLVAASTAPDTDWIVRLSDVAPDGTATLLTEGFLRASHREVDPARSLPERPYHTHTNPQPIEPGKFVPYDIEVWPTANEFKPGHRLRIQLTSHDSPNHTPGTLEVNRSAGRIRFVPHQPAENTVRYGESSVLLPILGEGSVPELAENCLGRRSAVGPRSIARVRVGYTRDQVQRRIEATPIRRTRRSYRWCVRQSRGEVTAVFSPRDSQGRVRLVTTTASTHGSRAVRPGATARAMRRAYPRRRALGRGLFRATPRSSHLIGVRRGRVEFFAVADRRLLRSTATVRRYIRLAGLSAGRI